MTYSKASYQSLSHHFVLRSNDERLATRAAELLSDFARAAPGSDIPVGAPMVYSLKSVLGANGQPQYSLHRDEDLIGNSHDPDEVIKQLLWQITGDTAELGGSHLLVHAGAVVTPAGDALVILGESGSGKTTLVAALVQEGCGYLSDEAAAISLDTGLVQPWPRPLGFRPESRSLPRFAPLFAPGSENEIHVAVGHIRPHAIAPPARIRHVINHRYEPGATTRLEPMSRGVALVLMGSAAPRLRHEGDRGLALLAGAVREAGTHNLLSGELEQGLRAVRQCVGL